MNEVLTVSIPITTSQSTGETKEEKGPEQV